MKPIFWEIWLLLKDAWRMGRASWRPLCYFGVVLGSIVILLFPNDPELLEWWIQPNEGEWIETARQISYWGDFLTGSVALSVLIWVAAAIGKSPHWRRIGTVCLMAAIIAGLTVNCFRLTLGRPRPHSEKEDGFYGLQRRAEFHGFPSGHSATAFGSATALAVAFPPMAVPALIGAGSVGWARMKLNRHYLSDVLVGGSTGVVCGVFLGWAVRRRNEEQPEPESED